MERDKHGLSIGFERLGDDRVLVIKATGKLSHEDYEYISPILDSALETVKHPNVKAFLDATELVGWEPRAAWDDLKLGLRHGNDFDKIAVLGNRSWEKLMTDIGKWFMSGEMRYFENYDEAVEWLRK